MQDKINFFARRADREFILRCVTLCDTSCKVDVTKWDGHWESVNDSLHRIRERVQTVLTGFGLEVRVTVNGTDSDDDPIPARPMTIAVIDREETYLILNLSQTLDEWTITDCIA